MDSTYEMPPQFVMRYHTAMRNVGLYTSISLALLGSSRFYRGKGNIIYNLLFLFLSAAFQGLAISLLWNFSQSIEYQKQSRPVEQQKFVDQWMAVSYYMNYILCTIFLATGYTALRQMTSGLKRKR
uniref:Uncharacterized protein n=1 Tax=viral metagenome TaxID=1070528 RepID=A0A6C0K8H3_9ZZZZ